MQGEFWLGKEYFGAQEEEEDLGVGDFGGVIYRISNAEENFGLAGRIWYGWGELGSLSELGSVGEESGVWTSEYTLR